MPLYCGIGGVKHKISGMYTGVGGVRKDLPEIWAAENGVKKRIYRARIEIGLLPVGTIVRLKENGELVEYILVHQGLPSVKYDLSCNGSWILRKDLLINHPYAEGENQPYFASSLALEWLNSQMYNWFDPSTREKILPVKIPYRADGDPPTTKTGAEGLQCRIFFLSAPEFGYDYAHHGDGTRLAYFESGNTPSANAKRAAQVNGKNEDYYTRSPDYRRGPVGIILCVSESGYFGTTNSTSPESSAYYGFRPAMIIQPDSEVSPDGIL